MKKILLVLGSITAVAIVGLSIAIFVALRHTASVAADATPYVSQAVVAITSNWSPAELYARMTPELRQAVSPEDIGALFEVASHALGPRETDVESEMLGWQSGASVRGGSTTAANFVVRVGFEKGSASFSITVQKIDGNWMISRFAINSSSLLRGMTGLKT